MNSQSLENNILKVRAVFVSDLHLGLSNTNLIQFIDWFKNVDCEYLFLVGDVLDLWALKRKIRWGASENLFIQKILRRARAGTKISYILGNHDEELKEFIGINFGGIEILEEKTYVTILGESILVIHGHQFDNIIACNKYVQYLGSTLYDLLLDFNTIFNKVRKFFGLDYWSVSKFLKSKTKEALQYVDNFEFLVVDYANKRGYDGVLMGHLHTPKIKTINGINYYNAGDWVENMTCIVEHLSGEMQLINLTEK